MPRKDDPLSIAQSLLAVASALESLETKIESLENAVAVNTLAVEALVQKLDRPGERWEKYPVHKGGREDPHPTR